MSFWFYIWARLSPLTGHSFHDDITAIVESARAVDALPIRPACLVCRHWAKPCEACEKLTWLACVSDARRLWRAQAVRARRFGARLPHQRYYAPPKTQRGDADLPLAA